MKEKLLALLVGIIFGIMILILVNRCGSKPDVTKNVTKKQGKMELVSTKTKVTFDTLKWITTYKANTKPVIKWKKPKNDTVLIESKPLFSPCDSVFVSLDSGTINGTKYAIQDTTADNMVIGRSIKFEVPQTQITKQVLKVNDSLRVDTIYVTEKQKFGTNAKWFFKGFLVGGSIGFIGGQFVPR